MIASINNPAEIRDKGLIAVLGAEVNESYQTEIWRGITEEAEKLERKLVFFMGFRSFIPDSQPYKYPFYRLAQTGHFGGMIIISSAISTYLQPEKVRSLFNMNPRIPKISIGLPMTGAGSVCVDGTEGMASLTEHMVVGHKMKNVALIAGPRQHPESEERKKTLRDVCRKKGILLDEELIYHGDFDKMSAREGIRNLLGKDKRIDVLFCLNDRMAIGAIEELSARGLSVPHDMTVCGFDDIEEARFCNPPLTTVSQPLYDLGSTAVRELYRLMDGDEPRHISLSCTPRIRRSCSCSESVFNGSGLKENRNAFRDLLDQKDPGEFFTTLDRKLSSSLFSTQRFGVLEEILTVKEKELKEQGIDWDETIKKARKNLWETQTRYLINRRLAKEQRSTLVRNIGISLTGSFDTPVLFRNLASGLVHLGFNDAYLVVYQNESDRKVSRLVFALENGNFVENLSEVFSGERILPRGEKDLNEGMNRSWMFTPLVFQDSALGHLLLPGNHRDTEIYETLTKQVASALQGAVLLEQVLNHEQSLEGEVKERTKELVRANRNLRKEISRRIKLEQEVTDISKHTMERIGQDLHDDLCQHLAGAALCVSALGYKISDLSPDAAEQAEEINRMLVDSISRTKGIVRGLVPLGIGEKGLSAALETLCSELSRSSGITIEFTGCDAVDIIEPERAVELYRIIQEALNNGIKHSKGDLIVLSLEIRKSGKQQVFFANIRDNGKGLESGDREKGGMGLKIMKYRGSRAGILVDVKSSTAGTTVTCEGEI